MTPRQRSKSCAPATSRSAAWTCCRQSTGWTTDSGRSASSRPAASPCSTTRQRCSPRTTSCSPRAFCAAHGFRIPAPVHVARRRGPLDAARRRQAALRELGTRGVPVRRRSRARRGARLVRGNSGTVATARSSRSSSRRRATTFGFVAPGRASEPSTASPPGRVADEHRARRGRRAGLRAPARAAELALEAARAAGSASSASICCRRPTAAG